MNNTLELTVTSPIGTVYVTYSHKGIHTVDFVTKQKDIAPADSLGKQIQNELNAYFAGKLTKFTVPLSPQKGTQFQKAVWKRLAAIPYGKTKTYKQIAEEVGSSKAFRAVGGSCNVNPIGIIVPCHRVLGSNGKLVGYAGGTDKKAWLLEFEKKNSFN
jgi:methylated-DNA-[protein]-cysteine S-methyltransferase